MKKLRKRKGKDLLQEPPAKPPEVELPEWKKKWSAPLEGWLSPGQQPGNTPGRVIASGTGFNTAFKKSPRYVQMLLPLGIPSELERLSQDTGLSCEDIIGLLRLFQPRG